MDFWGLEVSRENLLDRTSRPDSISKAAQGHHWSSFFFGLFSVVLIYFSVLLGVASCSNSLDCAASQLGSENIWFCFFGVENVFLLFFCVFGWS